MTEMEKHAFTRAINTLKALKCGFAIITPTGEKYGDLNVAQQNKKFVRKFLALTSRLALCKAEPATGLLSVMATAQC